MHLKGSLQILQGLPLSSLFSLPILPNYLEDVGHHVCGRLPLGTELHSKGLSFLVQDRDPRGVHQQGYHSQAFLLQGIEYHHKPARGVSKLSGTWFHQQQNSVRTVARPHFPWLAALPHPFSHLGAASNWITIFSGSES